MFFRSVEFLDFSGGRSWSASCSRSLLNHATYSRTASSSWLRVVQVRSAMSSVLKLSTKLSATALSSASPTVPIEASTP